MLCWPLNKVFIGDDSAFTHVEYGPFLFKEFGNCSKLLVSRCSHLGNRSNRYYSIVAHVDVKNWREITSI